MMNLKEAGRYSNFFTSLMQELNSITHHIEGDLKKRTETHKKNSALTSAEDEIKVTELKNTYNTTLATVERVLESVLSEKLRLANAISIAKRSMTITVDGADYEFDAAIEYAKLLRHADNGLYSSLDFMKEQVAETKAFGKTFNAEGNQVPYEYPVEIKTELLFDQAKVKAKRKSLKSLSNILSTEIEELSSKKIINFETEFDYLSSLQDILDTFALQAS